MVDIKKLEALKYAEPFRPFEIELKDGRVIRVREPLAIGWVAEIETLMFEGISRVKFDQVVAVRPSSGGRPRRKAS